jgi:hypothetical protein
MSAAKRGGTLCLPFGETFVSLLLCPSPIGDGGAHGCVMGDLSNLRSFTDANSALRWAVETFGPLDTEMYALLLTHQRFREPDIDAEIQRVTQLVDAALAAST